MWRTRLAVELDLNSVLWGWYVKRVQGLRQKPSQEGAVQCRLQGEGRPRLRGTICLTILQFLSLLLLPDFQDSHFPPTRPKAGQLDAWVLAQGSNLASDKEYSLGERTQAPEESGVPGLCI